MSKISSGLVAVAEVGAGFSLRWTEPDYGCSCKHYDKLVRLSDAEAIILDLQNLVTAENQRKQQFEAEVAAKDAEIMEQCRLNGMGAERELHLLAQVAAKDAEIERLKHKPTIEDADTTVDHLRAYAADNGYSHGDYADVMSEAASQIEQQSERIKELESDVDEEAHIRDRMAKLLAETAVALKGPEKALHRHGWQDLPDVAAKQSAALKLAKDALELCDVGDCSIDPMVMPSFDAVAVDEALAAIHEVLKGE